MNDYAKGVIDTCKALAANRKEFVGNVKRSSGYTDKGIKGNTYIQGILASWGK